MSFLPVPQSASVSPRCPSASLFLPLSLPPSLPLSLPRPPGGGSGEASFPHTLQAKLRPSVREEAVAGSGRKAAARREEQKSAKYKRLCGWGFLGPSEEGVGPSSDPEPLSCDANPSRPAPPAKEYTPFEARKIEARLHSLLIGVAGTQVKTGGISEKRGQNPGWVWEFHSLPPRKSIPFQQEGLKLDLKKDFQIALKRMGHRLGACEQWGTQVWKSLGHGVSRGPHLRSPLNLSNCTTTGLLAEGLAKKRGWG